MDAAAVLDDVSTFEVPRARLKRVNRGFGAVVFGSLVLHVGAFAGVLYWSSLQPKSTLDFESIPVELVSLGKERDPNLLPRKVRPRPAPAPQPEAAPEPEAPKAPEPAPDAVNLETKQKPEPKKKPRPRKQPTQPKGPSRAAQDILSGADQDLDAALDRLDIPEGSPDGSPFGTTTDAAHAASAYEARVQGLLKSKYTIPDTIPVTERGFLAAELIIYIDGNGNVTRYEITKRHSNPTFMGVLEQMLRSLKLPAPPKAMVSTYRSEGLFVRFKP